LIPADADDLFEQFSILRGELKTYNPELLDKNYAIAISKSDILDDELQQEMKNLAKKIFPDDDVLFISSVAQKGLTQLKDRLWDALNT
jgi:GTP-binding protein